jgi:hypothetical protein
MENPLPEEELIEYVRPILKAKGFKKNGKHWAKSDGTFTCVFFIQGSAYDKDDYYIRPGIIINEISGNVPAYGHITTQISIASPAEILDASECFFREWTNKVYLKEMVSRFMEWEERNPVEKRRAKEVDYDKDPVPSEVLFAMPVNAREYVLSHF